MITSSSKTHCKDTTQPLIMKDRTWFTKGKQFRNWNQWQNPSHGHFHDTHHVQHCFVWVKYFQQHNNSPICWDHAVSFPGFLKITFPTMHQKQFNLSATWSISKTFVSFLISKPSFLIQLQAPFAHCQIVWTVISSIQCLSVVTKVAKHTVQSEGHSFQAQTGRFQSLPSWFSSWPGPMLSLWLKDSRL